MAIDRFQVAITYDTAFARDKIVNVLHFEVASLSPDYNQLCHDLADIYQDHWLDGGAREIVVKAYDGEGAPPHFPKGTYTRNPGVIGPASQCPREVALCLSYYAGQNVPRKRGRIYLPVVGTSFNPAMRPSPTIMAKALAMGGFFAALGGANVSWNVWSTVDSVSRCC